jgi:hypothetical protein
VLTSADVKKAVCCQNLPLGALSSRNALSLLVGAQSKKFVIFLEHAEIQENAIRELRAIIASAFQEAFQQWKKRWERCIASIGDYFEGDTA